MKITTKHGVVTVKEPFFSWLSLCEVIELTLTPPNLDGWAVSKEIKVSDMSCEITKQFLEQWADEAITLII